MKDGLQKVPKGDKRSRRHVSFPGNLCLHLKDNSAPRQCKKGYKTPLPNLTHRIMGFWVPCILHYLVFLFSSLQINSIQIKSF
jgi:hypothetical protein